jgi:lysophospholipase L1-like esterase
MCGAQHPAEPHRGTCRSRPLLLEDLIHPTDWEPIRSASGELAPSAERETGSKFVCPKRNESEWRLLNARWCASIEILEGWEAKRMFRFGRSLRAVSTVGRVGLIVALALSSVACGQKETDSPSPRKFVPKPEHIRSAQAERLAPAEPSPTTPLEPADPLEHIRCDVQARPDATRWASDVRKYQEQDRSHFPEPGRVVFVGSSSIRLWKSLETDMAPVPTLRRGIGGAFVSDATHYAETLIAPYEPSAIVLYAGDNDIAKGLPPACIARDAQAFVAKVRELGVEAPIYFVSIKPSPARRDYWPKMQEANTLLQELAKSDPELHYIDVSDAMLSEDGQFKPGLFQTDKVHLSEQGYRTWVDRLRPALLRQS